MFTKAFLIVLLGTTFVLANPIKLKAVENQDYEIEVLDIIEELAIKDQERGAIAEIIEEKLKQLENKIDELAEKARKSIEQEKKIWEARLEEAKKIGQEQYEEMLRQAKKILDQLEKFYKGQIDELQRKLKDLIEKLRKIAGITY